MPFNEVSVGWRKRLRQTSGVSKREIHLGQMNPKKEFTRKQLYEKRIEQTKALLGRMCAAKEQRQQSEDAKSKTPDV